MSQKAPVPGILWVNSDVIKPNKLSRKDFNTWYCDQHIPDVVAKSGIVNAFRYEYIADGTSTDRRLGFLTVYGMLDIHFMETKEFRSLEGQTPGPSKERIFENAEFDTRSYELVHTDEAKGAGTGPAPFILYSTISDSSDFSVDEWDRGENVELISKCPGYRRAMKYKLATRSVLCAFERSFPIAPKWLVIYEFEIAELPRKELEAANEAAWAKKSPSGVLEVDFGWFELTRTFEKPKMSKL